MKGRFLKTFCWILKTPIRQISIHAYILTWGIRKKKKKKNISARHCSTLVVQVMIHAYISIRGIGKIKKMF
jgi:hypothetical protein